MGGRLPCVSWPQRRRACVSARQRREVTAEGAGGAPSRCFAPPPSRARLGRRTQGASLPAGVPSTHLGGDLVGLVVVGVLPLPDACHVLVCPRCPGRRRRVRVNQVRNDRRQHRLQVHAGRHGLASGVSGGTRRRMLPSRLSGTALPAGGARTSSSPLWRTLGTSIPWSRGAAMPPTFARQTRRARILPGPLPAWRACKRPRVAKTTPVCPGRVGLVLVQRAEACGA